MLNSDETRAKAESEHLRETRREIYGPFLLGLLLIIFCVGLMMSPLFPATLAGRDGIAIVANVMLMAMMILPVLLCVFPLVLLGVVLIFGVRRGQDKVIPPLRRLEDYSLWLSRKTASVTDKINEQTINASVRFVWLDRLLGIFETKEGDSDGFTEK